MGEKKVELEAAIARNAKAVVTIARVLAFGFMGELMGRNRITFEGWAIRFGWVISGEIEEGGASPTPTVGLATHGCI